MHFAPREGQDYHCNLVCITERERFIIGVSARGPRACFDFPDAVDFGLQPVRACAEEVQSPPLPSAALCYPLLHPRHPLLQLRTSPHH